MRKVTKSRYLGQSAPFINTWSGAEANVRNHLRSILVPSLFIGVVGPRFAHLLDDAKNMIVRASSALSGPPESEGAAQYRSLYDLTCIIKLEYDQRFPQ